MIAAVRTLKKNIVFLFEITFHSVDLSPDISGSWGILAKHAG